MIEMIYEMYLRYSCTVKEKVIFYMLPFVTAKEDWVGVIYPYCSSCQPRNKEFQLQSDFEDSLKNFQVANCHGCGLSESGNWQNRDQSLKLKDSKVFPYKLHFKCIYFQLTPLKIKKYIQLNNSNCCNIIKLFEQVYKKQPCN